MRYVLKYLGTVYQLRAPLFFWFSYGACCAPNYAMQGRRSFALVGRKSIGRHREVVVIGCVCRWQTRGSRRTKEEGGMMGKTSARLWRDATMHEGVCVSWRNGTEKPLPTRAWQDFRRDQEDFPRNA